jgi:putative addiction module component (TIGR02574 family)
VLNVSPFAEKVVSSWTAAYCKHIMSIAEVKQLPFAEKLQIMEAIWEDLRAQAERVPVPQWHKDLLDERRKAVEEGREELLDWDSIKGSLPSRRES